MHTDRGASHGVPAHPPGRCLHPPQATAAAHKRRGVGNQRKSWPGQRPTNGKHDSASRRGRRPPTRPSTRGRRPPVRRRTSALAVQYRHAGRRWRRACPSQTGDGTRVAAGGRSPHPPRRVIPVAATTHVCQKRPAQGVAPREHLQRCGPWGRHTRQRTWQPATWGPLWGGHLRPCPHPLRATSHRPVQPRRCPPGGLDHGPRSAVRRGNVLVRWAACRGTEERCISSSWAGSAHHVLCGHRTADLAAGGGARPAVPDLRVCTVTDI